MVKPGDIVRVKVLEVDKPRKRIALTLRLDDEVGPAPTAARATDTAPVRRAAGSRGAPAPRRDESGGGALAEALRRAGFPEKRR